MSWSEYYESLIAAGATPECADNTVGHLMDLYESYDWDAQIPFEDKGVEK